MLTIFNAMQPSSRTLKQLLWGISFTYTVIPFFVLDKYVPMTSQNYKNELSITLETKLKQVTASHRKTLITTHTIIIASNYNHLNHMGKNWCTLKACRAASVIFGAFVLGTIFFVSTRLNLYGLTLFTGYK